MPQRCFGTLLGRSNARWRRAQHGAPQHSSTACHGLSGLHQRPRRSTTGAGHCTRSHGGSGRCAASSCCGAATDGCGAPCTQDLERRHTHRDIESSPGHISHTDCRSLLVFALEVANAAGEKARSGICHAFGLDTARLLLHWVIDKLREEIVAILVERRDGRRHAHFLSLLQSFGSQVGVIHRAVVLPELGRIPGTASGMGEKSSHLLTIAAVHHHVVHRQHRIDAVALQYLLEFRPITVFHQHRSRHLGICP